MRLGGLLRLSTLDFPGLLGAVVFTQGCNFHCPYCHNPALVGAIGSFESNESDGPEGDPLEVEGVLSFLATRRGLLDGVVLSGGEPTLQGDLAPFLREIRALGFKVKLDTNGSRPRILGDLLASGLLDYVAMDLKADPENYPPGLASPKESQGIPLSLSILKESPVPHEFRTTVALPFADDAAIEAIARAASGDATLFLQRMDPSRGVLSPSFLETHPRQPGARDLTRLRDLASKYLPCQVR
ncbi:MAG: anaerobic ribonucleoside-triphosphate reductase activating protein [Deltaproteobacteria bacterium]|nr:anaerobic ribonucleoside-triphosphate reductase activating protein [Deltaproteobacteria bacterium]